MEIMHFDEINANTQRLAPGIFDNLRQYPVFVERDRLRGSFKYCWTKNARLIHAMEPILREFDQAGIEYRVIKGLAVQVALNCVGSRTIGDVDLLVRSADSEQAIQVIKKNGFRRNEEVACSGHSLVGHFAGLDFSKGETHLDLHVAEAKYPQKLLTMMMDTPSLKGSFGAFQMKVPDFEFLFLHSLIHGEESFGPTDFVQTLADLGNLLGHSNIDRIQSLAKECNLNIVLDRFQRRLKEQEIRSLGLSLGSVETPRFIRMRSTWHSATRRLSRQTLIARLQARRSGRENAVDSVNQKLHQRLAYRLWLATGQIAALERRMYPHTKGMLESPRDYLYDGLSHSPFNGTPSVPEIVALQVASRTLDWRFRVRVPDNTRVLLVHVKAAPLVNTELHAVMNGNGISRLIGGDPSTHTITLQNPPSDVEISLRPIWYACPNCFRDFKDMEITFEIISSKSAS
jgi:hypothetical protein